MRFNIKSIYFIFAALFLSLLFTSGCSLFQDTEIVRAPPNEDLQEQRERERRESLGLEEDLDETFIGRMFNNITGTEENKGSNNGGGIGVNTFLWRATLDTLSFMPLISADPFGGVIITDWHTGSEESKEKFKVVAYIIGTELRVDGIKISIFKKIKNESGLWVDKKSGKILQNKVEDAILTKARKYKIQNIK